MNYKITANIAVLVIVLQIFNQQITYFIFPFLYAISAFFGCVIFLLVLVRNKLILDARLKLGFILLVFYIMSLTLVAFFQSLLSNPGHEILSGIIFYSYNLIFWFLFALISNKNDMHKVVKCYIRISAVVSLLAIVQMFYSPHLWGFTGLIDSNLFNWTKNSNFDSYFSYFRATSIFVSPQQLSAFASLSIIMLSISNNAIGLKLNGFERNVFFGLLTIAGFLSGSKLFIIALFISMLITFYKYKIVLIYCLLGMVLLSFIETEQFGFLNRMLSLDAMIQQEQTDSRIDRYLNVITETDPLIGNGLGTNSLMRQESGEISVESFILQLWYEGGIGLFLVFSSLLFISFLLSFKSRYGHPMFFIFIFLWISSVHSLNNPAVSIAYFFIMLPFFNKFERSEKSGSPL